MPLANDDECKKILDAMLDYWYYKILNKMAVKPYPPFEAALQELIEEMKE